ncbi:Pyruvate/Phosphoenolpyruvate kinase-like domain-containing protein [Endogone sp. FLAS-F59071]|nr:Pyruvate/Phosphoenolpyruvate kinase-like domain-containing protein [Endogone sp. FLAS-F59071]|eukprot:RUS14533.1 Pyruvate/Phosphoenolpyruvate kinase-like domain-containing protein [Endogone sp. FLAS-F59071]
MLPAFSVPGSDERKIHKSISLGADCIVYDLEDSVASNKKGNARRMVIDALEVRVFGIRKIPKEIIHGSARNASEHGKAEKAVRINAVGSGLEYDDLNVVVSCGLSRFHLYVIATLHSINGVVLIYLFLSYKKLHSTRLQAIVIPKVQSAHDIQFVVRMIDSVAPELNRANIRLLASIESGLGILNLREIATADPRVDALVVCLIRTPSRKEMLYARQAVVTAASAFGLQAIDLDFYHLHRPHLDPDIARAAKILEGYEAHSQKGVGAFNLDGKMIDLPVVKWADKIVARAKAASVEIPGSSTAGERETKKG